MQLKYLTSVFILFLFALLVRIGAVALWDFDGLYGQDAYSYYENAKLIYGLFPDVSSILSEYWPAGRAAPIGYSSAVALVFILFGATPLAGQVLSLLAGSLLAPALFLLTTSLFRAEGLDQKEGFWAGAIAGGVGVLSGVLIRSSIVVMADALGLFLAVCAAWLALRYEQRRNVRDLILGASLVSLMIIVRLPNAFIGLVILIYFLLYIYKPARIPVSHIFMVAGVALLILLPQILLWYRVGDETITGSTLGNWNLRNVISSQFETPNGRQVYVLPNFLFYFASVVYPPYFSPLGVPAIIAGLLFVFRRKLGRTSVLVGGWALILWLVLAGGQFQNLRYAESYFPPLAVLTGIGFSHLLARWRKQRPLIMVWVSVTFSTMGLSSYFYLDKFLEKKDIERTIVAWVTEHCSSDMNIVAFEISPALKHYSQMKVEDLFYHDTSSVKDLLNPDKTLLFVDINDIESQWRETRVFHSLVWIREHYVVTEVGRVVNYNILLVGKRS